MDALRTILFSNVVPAIANAQERLEGSGKHYAIPRARARVHTHLDREGGPRGLFQPPPPGEHNANIIRYSVVAAPAPYWPNEKLTALPLRLPRFLLPAALEQTIAKEALASAGLEVKSGGDPDKGLLCFPLAEPDRYFVAQVGAKPKDDVILIYTRGDRATQPSRLRYGAFHHLFMAIASWQRSGVWGDYQTATNADLQWGWRPLQPLLTTLWEDYKRAAAELAERKPSGTPPVFHRIDDFHADFYYSPWRQKHLEPSLPHEHDSWIHNHAIARYDSLQRAPELELRVPEFVLSGAVRDNLIGQIQAAARDIAKEFEDVAGPKPEAATFETSPQDALILLSYENECPTKGFLTIWPTRDATYLFTFDSDGLKLKDGMEAHAILPPGQELAAIIREKTYKVVHNFFRAVRLWRSRTVVKEEG